MAFREFVACEEVVENSGGVEIGRWVEEKEEITRCRDCVYSVDEHSPHGWFRCCQRWWREKMDGWENTAHVAKYEPDGFCSWGKRKAEK